MPGLDPRNTNPCYIAGRLFAHYEQIQRASARVDGGSEPKATFADKHLAGALTDPRTALTVGEKQVVGWLVRLRRSGKDYHYRRDLDELVALLDPDHPIPARASLDDQAIFILGYHHQRAHVQHRWAEHKAGLANSDAESDKPTTDDPAILQTRD